MKWSLLRWLLAAALAAHAVAHSLGFAIAWQLTASPEIPYHTTLMNGRFDVGATGIRAIGILWLIAGAGFLVCAALVAAGSTAALLTLAAVSMMSLSLCALEWPFARIGFFIDAGVAAALVVWLIRR